MSRVTKGERVISYEATHLRELVVWQLPSMQAARPSIYKAKLGFFKKAMDRDRESAAIVTHASYGNQKRLGEAVLHSEQLIQDVIAYDDRFAAKPQWVRGEEGIDACPALFAQGDDAPFLRRRKQLVREASGGDPIRIVVSTDDNEVKPLTGAAFIAAVRLAQQFHPVEVWWQGAWLSDDQRRGFVFHIPIIQGDMDFTKLDYIIHDRTRDSFSWCIKTAKAMEMGVLSNDKVQAGYSYLPNTTAFVDHGGIPAGPEDIAREVCRWLGWENRYWADRVAVGDSALQRMPEPHRTYNETPAERFERERRMKQYDAEQKARLKQAAADRESALS